jgi:hypothetical protein
VEAKSGVYKLYYLEWPNFQLFGILTNTGPEIVESDYCRVAGDSLKADAEMDSGVQEAYWGSTPVTGIGVKQD